MFSALLRIMKAKKLLPRISDTERQALEAGSVWIDGEFFGGKPDFKHMMAQPYNRLSPQEQAFIDGPAEQLCHLFDPYEVERTRQIPEDVIRFIKEKGFMGLLVPKAYGGLEFSTLGVSTVLHKLSPYSSIVATLVTIANSLSAAELLKHYGTPAQKEHYLPRLASGDYMPCFALTEPTAGSDAASLRAEGTVFKDEDGGTKIRLNFRKRYITLAPIATLISLACRLRDPDNLLGKGEDVGITVVMIHKGTPGLISGDHHRPIGEPFYNGPIEGKNVVVPVDDIIGGPERAGQGWRMLMEQLAGGRAVSLPAGAVGGIKTVAAVTGAYSMVRRQFGIPVGLMEGVEDKVGKIAALAYLTDAARIYACSAIDGGEQPPVISAVLKAYTTELARELINDGMDVFSGAGVMQGPNNILGMAYASAPVGITVEGANIMTRTLIIFGQGATRCHPYALAVVEAAENDDVPTFRASLLAWCGHFLANVGRSAARYLTRGRSAGSPVAGPTATYYRRLSWVAARFAVLTDLALFFMGGKLKARGRLSGRYADVLAWQILATAALRRWEAEGRKTQDLALVRYACEHALAQIQRAFEDMYQNFDAPVLGGYLRTVGSWLLRLNPLGHTPADRLSHDAARAIQQRGEQYQRLTADLVTPSEDAPGAGRLLRAWRLIGEAEPAMRKIAAAQKAKSLPRGAADALADEALQAGIVDEAEAKALRQAMQARLEVIEVDQFTPEAFFGVTGLTGAPGFGPTTTERGATSATG